MVCIDEAPRFYTLKTKGNQKMDKVNVSCASEAKSLRRNRHCVLSQYKPAEHHIITENGINY